MKKRLQGVLGLAVLIMVLLALSGCSTADVNAAFQALNDAGPSVSTPGLHPLPCQHWAFSPLRAQSKALAAIR